MMTYAAILRFAALASRHALTEDELLATLRTARATNPATITIAAIENAIAAVVKARIMRAA